MTHVVVFYDIQDGAVYDQIYDDNTIMFMEMMQWNYNSALPRAIFPNLIGVLKYDNYVYVYNKQNYTVTDATQDFQRKRQQFIPIPNILTNPKITLYNADITHHIVASTHSTIITSGFIQNEVLLLNSYGTPDFIDVLSEHPLFAGKIIGEIPKMDISNYVRLIKVEWATLAIKHPEPRLFYSHFSINTIPFMIVRSRLSDDGLIIDNRYITRTFSSVLYMIMFPEDELSIKLGKTRGKSLSMTLHAMTVKAIYNELDTAPQQLRIQQPLETMERIMLRTIQKFNLDYQRDGKSYFIHINQKLLDLAVECISCGKKLVELFVCGGCDGAIYCSEKCHQIKCSI